MSTLADLKAALDQQGDFLTALGTRISAIVPADPSQQADIDAMVSELGDHNNTIQALAPAAGPTSGDASASSASTASGDTSTAPADDEPPAA